MAIAMDDVFIAPVCPGAIKAKRKSSWYGTSQNSGYYKPWSGIQLCENCPAIK